MSAIDDKNAHILVVEDEAIIAALIEHSLTAQGFQTTLAEDGQTAWEMISQAPKRFDAIMLDRSMPRMDGLTLLGKLRGWSESAQIPIVDPVFRTVI